LIPGRRQVARGPFAATVGAAAVVLVATVVAPGPVTPGVVLLGVLIGAGNGLPAVDLVLTYRSHRVVNFALAGMGGLGAALAVGLHLGQGVPWPVAVLPGVRLGLLGGAPVERVVLRRLEHSPRLVATVATIGPAQLFAPEQARPRPYGRNRAPFGQHGGGPASNGAAGASDRPEP
jgi:hypothetical protein